MDLSDALHHPLFESVILPLLLSLLGVGLLRAVSGPGRAAAAVGLSLLVSAIWMAGWSSQPGSTMQRLPWIFAVAWLAGVVLNVAVGSRLLHWVVLSVVWLAASWWLGSRGLGEAIAFALGGAAVIACLLGTTEDRADGAAIAVVSSLGLAGLALTAGSLALFQFSLMLAAAVGGAALWLWPKARIRFGVAAVGVATISWLALAQATLLLIPARPSAVAALTLAFAAALVAAPVVGRLAIRARPFTAPLVVAVLAGACVAAALALQRAGVNEVGGAKAGTAADDAYYPK